MTHDPATMAELRARRDATGAELFDEPDGALQEIIDAPVGAVSETTRELARLEMTTRLEGR